MNKKLFIPIFVLVAIIPAIGLLSENDNTSTSNPTTTAIAIPHTDKTVSFADFDSKPVTFPESVRDSSLIIHGTIIGTESFEKKINPEHKVPWTFTIATVQITEVLKGDYSKDIVKVQMIGGETENTLTIVDGSLAKDNDQVVMFLDKDDDSIFAPHYSLITQNGGMFTILDSNAANHNDSISMPLDRLLESIKVAAQR